MYILIIFIGLNLPAVAIGEFSSKSLCFKFAEEKVQILNSETPLKGACIKKEDI